MSLSAWRRLHRFLRQPSSPFPSNAISKIKALTRAKSLIPPPTTGIYSVALASPTAEPPSVWLAISVVTGLPLALWAYKCLMLLLFQRKIIYMGYAPIGARDEQLSDVPEQHLKGLECTEVSIPNGRNTSLSGIVVRAAASVQAQPTKAAIIYFQGNAGNPLHRLPLFQTLLSNSSPSSTKSKSSKPPLELELDIISIPPRSYWKSTPRRPTQTGILSDYRRVVDYTLDRYPSIPIILYGHSLGGAIAVCLASQLSTSPRTRQHRSPVVYSDPRYHLIKGLILENPFTSIPDMVRTLYTERWVPYRYLAPLAFDKWDALSAMQRASSSSLSLSFDTDTFDADDSPEGGILRMLRRKTLLLVSEKDEIVPPWMSAGLASSVAGVGEGQARTVVIQGALHENAWQQRQWSIEMTGYINDILRAGA